MKWKKFDVVVEEVVTYRFDNLSVPDYNIFGYGCIPTTTAIRAATEFAGLEFDKEYRIRLYRNGKLIKKLVDSGFDDSETLRAIYEKYYEEELGEIAP